MYLQFSKNYIKLTLKAKIIRYVRREMRMKTAFYVEAYGKQAEEKDIVTKIKELWVAEGNKIKDIKEISIYAKPEDNAVYYIINGEVSGEIALFD